jgi:hypothetical protein
VICEEKHPLKAGESLFRVYTETMQPLNIEGESFKEAKVALRSCEQVHSLIVLFQPELLREA